MEAKEFSWTGATRLNITTQAFCCFDMDRRMKEGGLASWLGTSSMGLDVKGEWKRRGANGLFIYPLIYYSLERIEG